MSDFHPNSFLADYLFYNSGNECQENYHIWSAIVAAAVQLQRRVWLPFEYYDIHPNLYVVLVGKQGNRKSTAKDIMRDLVVDVNPNLPVSKSVMSREKICQFLGTDDARRVYQDHLGETIEYRPIFLCVNELKNFLSINPQGMVEFLTDIYDRKLFDVGTKNAGNDFIPNPCVNLLACETPEWIAERMKEKIISGGFSRRVIYIYEFSERKRIPFPTIPNGGLEAWERVKNTLRRMQTYSGPMSWHPSAREWYAKWYIALKAPATPVLGAFYESKHIQMLKVAMILELADRGKLELTIPSLETASALVDVIEPGIAEIGLTVGRNELVIATRNMFHVIRANGGIIPEKRLQSLMFSDMSPMEFQSTLQHMITTEQLKKFEDVVDGVSRTFVCTIEKAEEINRLKKEKNDNKPSS